MTENIVIVLEHTYGFNASMENKVCGWLYDCPNLGIIGI